MKAIALALPIALLAACQRSPEVASTPTTASISTPQQQVSDEVERQWDINRVEQVGPLEIQLGQAAYGQGYLAIGLTATNKGREAVSWYPDQGAIVVGQKMINANGFYTVGDPSGEIEPGLLRDGAIAFPMEAMPEGTVQLRLGAIVGEDFRAIDEVVLEVEL